MVGESVSTNGTGPQPRARVDLAPPGTWRGAYERVGEILALADVAETALHVNSGDAVDRESVPRILGMIVERARLLANDLNALNEAATGGATHG